MLSFEPKAFPKDFLKGLVYDLEADCPVYTLTVQGDPKTRQIHFYNGEDVHIYSLDPDKDYDSRWLAWLLRPGIYDAKTPAQERTAIEDWLDPARVEIDRIGDVLVCCHAISVTKHISRCHSERSGAESRNLRGDEGGDPSTSLGMTDR